MFGLRSKDCYWWWRRHWLQISLDCWWYWYCPCRPSGRKVSPTESSAIVTCPKLWMRFSLLIRLYQDGLPAWYWPDDLRTRYSTNGTISPPLLWCTVILCLLALYFLVKCSEQVAHIHVNRPISNIQDNEAINLDTARRYVGLCRKTPSTKVCVQECTACMWLRYL